MFFVLLAANTVVQFLHVDHAATKGLLKWWEPQIVNGNLIAHHGNVRNYVKATINLQEPSNACGLLSSDLSLFVVDLEQGVCELRACLWQPDVSRVCTMRILRQWLFDIGYKCVANLDGDDMDVWKLSEYDS